MGRQLQKLLEAGYRKVTARRVALTRDPPPLSGRAVGGDQVTPPPDAYPRTRQYHLLEGSRAPDDAHHHSGTTHKPPAGPEHTPFRKFLNRLLNDTSLRTSRRQDTTDFGNVWRGAVPPVDRYRQVSTIGDGVAGILRIGRGFLRQVGPGVQYATRMTSTNTRAPSIGRIVQYTLTSQDCQRVRSDRIARLDAGLTVDGYNPNPGQISPMIVTWTSGPAGDFISGQVYLDSNDILWVERVKPSDTAMQGPGCWHWPVTV